MTSPFEIQQRIDESHYLGKCHAACRRLHFVKKRTSHCLKCLYYTVHHGNLTIQAWLVLSRLPRLSRHQYITTLLLMTGFPERHSPLLLHQFILLGSSVTREKKKTTCKTLTFFGEMSTVLDQCA